MKKCLGFPDGKECNNPVGSKWDSPYYCQECDEARIKHIDEQFKEMEKQMEAMK